MAGPTYMVGFNNCSQSVKSIHIGVALLDTEAVFNLMYSSLIPFGWRDRAKEEALPKLRTAKKQPLQIEGLTLLHLHPGDLCTCD